MVSFISPFWPVIKIDLSKIMRKPNHLCLKPRTQYDPNFIFPRNFQGVGIHTGPGPNTRWICGEPHPQHALSMKMHKGAVGSFLRFQVPNPLFPTRLDVSNFRSSRDAATWSCNEWRPLNCFNLIHTYTLQGWNEQTHCLSIHCNFRETLRVKVSKILLWSSSKSSVWPRFQQEHNKIAWSLECGTNISPTGKDHVSPPAITQTLYLLS